MCVYACFSFNNDGHVFFIFFPIGTRSVFCCFVVFFSTCRYGDYLLLTFSNGDYLFFIFCNRGYIQLYIYFFFYFNNDGYIFYYF